MLRPDELRAPVAPTPAREAPPDGTVAGGGPAAVELRDIALLELLYGSGLRIAEATALDVDEVDLGRGGVVVWGKGGKQRTVPAQRAGGARPAPLAGERRPRWPPMHTPAGAVFLNMRGRRLTPGTSAHHRPAGERADPPARLAAHLRHAPARRWR